MKHLALSLCLLLLAACATARDEERIDAVKDFVAVTELPATDSIRTYEQLDHEVLNDRYVIVSTRREQYLLEYASRCYKDPFTNRVKPDIRRDSRHIYAGQDTFRGCLIRAIYPINEAQAQELRELGEAPGE